MGSNTNAYVGMGGSETRWQSPPINTDAEVQRLVGAGELLPDEEQEQVEVVEEASVESVVELAVESAPEGGAESEKVVETQGLLL